MTTTPPEQLLTPAEIDKIFDAHQEAPQMAFRYLVTEALQRALLAKLREQQPVAWQFRLRADSHDSWSAWMRCDEREAKVYLGRPRVKDISYEARALYTAPVPTPAQAAQAVPAGWKLMPVEPNTAMLDAVSSCHEGRLYPQDFVHGPRAMRRQEYAAWLAAAPTPTGAGDAHAGERKEPAA